MRFDVFEEEEGKFFSCRDISLEFLDIFLGYLVDFIIHVAICMHPFNQIRGDATLRLMAAELVKIIRQNAGVDWTLRKNIQAKMRVSVKRLLKKYGYPPDMQKLATENILKQAELLCRDVGLSVA